MSETSILKMYETLSLSGIAALPELLKDNDASKVATAFFDNRILSGLSGPELLDGFALLAEAGEIDEIDGLSLSVATKNLAKALQKMVDPGDIPNAVAAMNMLRKQGERVARSLVVSLSTELLMNGDGLNPSAQLLAVNPDSKHEAILLRAVTEAFRPASTSPELLMYMLETGVKTGSYVVARSALDLGQYDPFVVIDESFKSGAKVDVSSRLENEALAKRVSPNHADQDDHDDSHFVV